MFWKTALSDMQAAIPGTLFRQAVLSSNWPYVYRYVMMNGWMMERTFWAPISRAHFPVDTPPVTPPVHTPPLPPTGGHPAARHGPARHGPAITQPVGMVTDPAAPTAPTEAALPTRSQTLGLASGWALRALKSTVFGSSLLPGTTVNPTTQAWRTSAPAEGSLSRPTPGRERAADGARGAGWRDFGHRQLSIRWLFG